MSTHANDLEDAVNRREYKVECAKSNDLLHCWTQTRPFENYDLILSRFRIRVTSWRMLLDNAESEADHDDKHARQAALHARDDLGDDHWHAHREAGLVDLLILGQVGSLLHQAEEDHAAYPDLDAQQIAPVAQRAHQPEQRKHRIDAAH